jgi:phospholipid transport system transporter-binding protein
MPLALPNLPARVDMLALPAELLQATANQALLTLTPALQAAGESQLTVDASALTRFDSTALAVCLALRRAAERAGKSLVWQGVPPRLADLAKLYGIAELLPAQV